LKVQQLKCERQLQQSSHASAQKQSDQAYIVQIENKLKEFEYKNMEVV